MALLLAGLPDKCRAQRSTVCAARAWMRSGSPRAPSAPAKRDLVIAGGVESMTRAPFVMGKADAAFSRSAKIEDTTHRLALRQSADEGEVRHRLDAGDCGERGARSSASRAPTRTRSRCAASSALRARMPHGRFAEEIVAGADAAEEGRAGRRRRRRASASRHDAGGAGEARSRVVRPDGTRDGGQCVGRQRRSCALLLAQRSAAATHRSDAACARGRRRRRPACRRASWASARARDAQAARAGGLSLDQMDVDRAERSVRRAGARGDCASWASRRCAARQSERRRHRARPSARRERRAAGRRPRSTSCERTGGRYALCTMCIGVGQGIAMVIERV